MAAGAMIICAFAALVGAMTYRNFGRAATPTAAEKLVGKWHSTTPEADTKWEFLPDGNVVMTANGRYTRNDMVIFGTWHLDGQHLTIVLDPSYVDVEEQFTLEMDIQFISDDTIKMTSPDGKPLALRRDSP